MEEIYRQIPGFNLYQVSNLGNVKLLNFRNTEKERVLKPTHKKKGSPQITLIDNEGNNKTKLVYTLIREVFKDDMHLVADYIPKKDGRGTKPNFPNASQEQIEAILNSKLTIRQIAKEYGFSPTYIRNLFVKAGIKKERILKEKVVKPRIVKPKIIKVKVEIPKKLKPVKEQKPIVKKELKPRIIEIKKVPKIEVIKHVLTYDEIVKRQINEGRIWIQLDSKTRVLRKII